MGYGFCPLKNFCSPVFIGKLKYAISLKNIQKKLTVQEILMTSALIVCPLGKYFSTILLMICLALYVPSFMAIAGSKLDVVEGDCINSREELP